MSPSKRSLEALRRQIDEIDETLHDLLIRRTALVEEIGALKSGGKEPYFRPAREAAILRRLAGRHRGAFALGALLRIWREMMGALVRLQGPFAVSVFAPPEHRAYWDIARDHFGTTMPLTAVPAVAQVIRDVGEGRATAGILPWPHENHEDPWWRHLFHAFQREGAIGAKENEPPVRIFARLPFYDGARDENSPRALAIGRLMPEATGDDRSFLGIESGNELSRTRLLEVLGEHGVTAAIIAQWRDRAESGRWLYLVEAVDFIASDDPRLTLLDGDPSAVFERVVHLGTYALPLSDKERQDKSPSTSAPADSPKADPVAVSSPTAAPSSSPTPGVAER